MLPLHFKQACQSQKRLWAECETQLVILDRYKSHIASKFIYTFLNAQQSGDLIYSLKLMLQNYAIKITTVSHHKCQSTCEWSMSVSYSGRVFALGAFSLHGWGYLDDTGLYRAISRYVFIAALISQSLQLQVRVTSASLC